MQVAPAYPDLTSVNKVVPLPLTTALTADSTSETQLLPVQSTNMRQLSSAERREMGK